MGKIHCEGCKKSCKGQAIRLQDTYFHIKCFKCKECKKQLAAGGFYTKDGQYFCGDDYQKLFGTKCAACGKYVEGEVVTALGNTYHQTCFHCTRCDKTFGPGDKVTYTGKDYLCNACLEETSAVTTPQEEAEHTPNGKPVEPMEVPQVAINAESIVKPAASSTPARPLQDGPAIRATTDNTLNSPISDMSDIYTDKENVTNGDRAVSSPVSTTRTSGYRSDAESPRPQMSPHNTSHYSRDSSLFDEFLAMPDRKGRDSGYMPSHNETLDSVTDSVFVDNTHTDTDRQERLSPVQNMMQYRSPSPCTSTVSKSSRKSRDSTLSSSSRREVDYGKFYNTSYLQKPSGAQIKGPSINPKGDPKSPHYHRPENFSYSQVRRDFIKPLKKESSSMMSALGETMTVQKKKLEDFMEEPMKNKEVIDLARFPDNTKHDGDRQFAIEREDFPAPPATAAAYPELLYKQYKPPRKSRGSDVDSPDGGQQMEIDGEEVPEVDPKLLKDIDHLSKLERESGAAKVILEHLKKKSKEPPPPIDPVSSSRTPAADREPMYKTRYESHVFASPSRDLDHRSRMYSLDDQIIGRKYRSALQSVGNFPVDRRTYDLPKARSNKYTVMKPGYTLRQPKTAHMPSTFASARANGYFSDIEQCVTRDSDFEDLEARRYDVLERRALNFNRRDHELDRRSQELDRRSQELDRRSQDLDQRSQDAERRSQKSHSLHASQSSIEYEYDPITGLRRGTKLRGSSVSSDLMKTKSPYQKTLASFKSDDPPQIYDYDDLKITNLNLPPGVDRNVIEIHLSQQEFESIFRMSREEFYRLAEWKRNDMKQRVLLF